MNNNIQTFNLTTEELSQMEITFITASKNKVVRLAVGFINDIHFFLIGIWDGEFNDLVFATQNASLALDQFDRFSQPQEFDFGF